MLALIQNECATGTINLLIKWIKKEIKRSIKINKKFNCVGASDMQTRTTN